MKLNFYIPGMDILILQIDSVWFQCFEVFYSVFSFYLATGYLVFVLVKIFLLKLYMSHMFSI